MNIPTSRTGAVQGSPQTTVGIYHWNLYVREYINILTTYQQLSLDQVRAFYGWFMGDAMSTLTKYSDMNINTINLNEAGNLVLVNRYKLRLQQLGGTLPLYFEESCLQDKLKILPDQEEQVHLHR